jgi:hypothetical protein
LSINRKLAVVAAAGALALVGPAAFADTFYNVNLEDPVSVDAQLETMSLTYDSSIPQGTSATATIALRQDGHALDDHANCNVQGAAHYVTLAATSNNTGIATVSLSNGGRFDTCASTIGATVTSQGVGGPATITFSIVDDETSVSGDPHLVFDTSGADFRVMVSEATSGQPTGCADPAAPAWSAALMQASGVKSGSKDWQNVQSKVALAMTTRANFPDGNGYVAKSAHPDYENAVRTFVAATLTGKTIVSPDAAKVIRPGWICVAIS